MSLKYSISSPLEAGTSVLDRSMPSHVNSALEYTSKRLSRKDIHLTLVIVRRDYQLPSKANSPGWSTSSASSPAALRSLAPLSSPNTATGKSSISLSSIKNIVRSNTFPLTGLSSTNAIHERTVNVKPSYDEGLRTGMISPAFSVSSMSSMASTVSTVSTAESSIGSSRRWPLSPTTPYSLTMPATPATPHSEVSMSTHTTTDASSAVSGIDGPLPANTFGVRLVHTSPVSLKEEKVLKQTMQKAERKFHLGPDWFPPAVAPSECGLTADVIHRSLAQNEPIFSSNGLCLLTLDHLYTFKSALSSYAKTQSSCMLEDAVDELRRLVLAQGGRKLQKSVLLSSFLWLGPVSDSALSDVSRMYRRAYGGIAGESGLENDVDAPTNSTNISASWPLPDQPVFINGSDVEAKPLPAPPDEAWQSSSDAASESGESSGWESEDLPSLCLSRTSRKGLDKRFAIVGLDSQFGLDFQIEDYYRLSSARDLLTEREEAEAAAWAAAGASGEIADQADGVLLPELASRKQEAVGHLHLTDPSPKTASEEDILFLPVAIADAEIGRSTPKVAEKPKLQLQTSPASPLLGITKPVALRMPMLKLQTTFTTKPVLPKLAPIPPLSHRLTLSGAETTLNLVGMTPTEGVIPSFDSLLARHNINSKPYEDEEDGELTAKPTSGHPSRQHRWTQRWNSLVSIDGRLATPPLEQQQDSQLGPMTPNGYEDISPITRGEWGFLFQGETWQSGRTVTVERC
ncbi:hypothetical protein BR93DRAFT_976382 [Coniochaeta sp. PMI_546]|nr:hypothetical protein BR93DRAFT_976382 [Coniochaeta sp. PMI_546]